MERKPHNNTLSLRISPSLLDGAFQGFTKLLILSLPQANSVTSFLVGPVPHLKLTYLGTAARNRETNKIQWQSSASMDCSLSGKTWKDLRDARSDDLNALSSCLRNQNTWTSSGSKTEFNKALKMSSGKVIGNQFHWEPILMKKDALWNRTASPSVYPKDKAGRSLWFDCDCVTVALIKIDLVPGSFLLDSDYWEITEKVTEGLALQLLHLHTEQFFLQRIKRLEQDRNEIIQILIIQIRQIMTRLSLVYRMIDNQVAYIRKTWEDLVHKHNPEQPCKSNIINQLNLLLETLERHHNGNAESKIIKQLAWYQNKLAEYCFMPEENEVWFQQKIEPLWRHVDSKLNSSKDVQGRIKTLLTLLENSFYVGSNETLSDNIDNIPKSIRSKWINLAYNEKTLTKVDYVKEYIHLLRSLDIEPIKQNNMIDNLVCLRKLAMYIEQLENNLNHYIDIYEIHNSTDKEYLH